MYKRLSKLTKFCQCHFVLVVVGITFDLRGSCRARQVAGVLDQLGVQCDVAARAGPFALHVVAKMPNPRTDGEDIVYECCEASCYCALRQDDKNGAPQPLASTKLRHKLLQRLGVQLVQINVWEWNRLSEAQRVNYMVKMQSL
ncbi:hypothetical protein AK812_SmicGene7874 [Symbiodinium microadriaticum]|uniref:RAP domain-containing protein n=1 Tax=Symbiodinium microadriaticum TaxID=2951 RepID=A0A1Q9EMH3_SYMMI|nr:hypothetical protein AK812_SmicGene7874 [Symbiodinium microadriaticum]